MLKDSSASKLAQQNYVRGKGNHVTAETAKDAPKVMIGIFPVNSNYASVLFDSVATHSYIAYPFVKKHGTPTRAMKLPLIVLSPGGEEEAKLRCPAVSLVLRG